MSACEGGINNGDEATVERASPFETLLVEAYERGWNEGCETTIEDANVDFFGNKPETPHKDVMGEGCGTFMSEVWPKLNAALTAHQDGPGEDLRATLRTVEFRLALKRITEHYPPDTVAGRLAADALAKHPNPFENADRENDCEPFDVPEIKGLRLGGEQTGWSAP